MSEEDERRQFDKIKFKWPDNRKFRQTRKDLLAETPELMSGIPREMKYDPNKKVERSNWEYLGDKKRKSHSRRNMKGIFILLMFCMTFISYFVYSEYQTLQLNNFQTRKELNRFLYHDPISNKMWSESYNCDSFAKDLIINAKDSNYFLKKITVENPNKLWPEKMRYWFDSGPHALCIAYIESENQWYYIEPQSDEVLGIYEDYPENPNPFTEIAKWIIQIEKEYLFHYFHPS